MKTIVIKFAAFIAVCTLGTSSVFAQNSTIPAVVSERTVENAQLGSLICEDANGKMVLCSGNLEETVLGIATNVPYVTINKPATPDASKFIFNAMVSDENGAIRKGDLLVAAKGGSMAKASVSDANAYAIALEDANGNGTIRVKLINR